MDKVTISPRTRLSQTRSVEPQDMVIDLAHVTAGYGGRDVIRDFNLTIHAGEIHAVIGPNGSGKSTLLKTIAGLIPTSFGTVRIKGQSLDEWDRMDLAKVLAFLPQSRDVPLLDVETLVAHGRFPHQGYFRHQSAQDKQKIDEAMVTLGIGKFRHKSLKELSGGERQKAYLAMMLAQDAEILLLDEPTTFLDAGFQLEILGCLHELNALGKTIVLVLHDLNHALGHADRVSLIEQGNLLLTAPPAELIGSQLIDRVFGVAMKTLASDDRAYYVIDPPNCL